MESHKFRRLHTPTTCMKSVPNDCFYIDSFSKILKRTTMQSNSFSSKTDARVTEFNRDRLFYSLLASPVKAEITVLFTARLISCLTKHVIYIFSWLCYKNYNNRRQNRRKQVASFSILHKNYKTSAPCKKHSLHIIDLELSVNLNFR